MFGYGLTDSLLQVLVVFVVCGRLPASVQFNGWLIFHFPPVSDSKQSKMRGEKRGGAVGSVTVQDERCAAQ